MPCRDAAGGHNASAYSEVGKNGEVAKAMPVLKSPWAEQEKAWDAGANPPPPDRLFVLSPEEHDSRGKLGG
eukprot:CAMPEP_0174319330 /NCGR_PEP_ID=MMETSP0810-20121108/8796_1 /TAXON_ID=73025 ORGANISM="Eutreptiella gymnastica-like, Strain CCMP1594" /NCGR_SAMPLE_ID=MMETSP0810 /ASSEMBLY_ACC=CAM_ASM_000659 /LENGTH=70 /DNA_ID=CAMNT_0015429843 /DNA_START=424 /DNA_END=637 /DNA_ORIENTATION=-